MFQVIFSKFNISYIFSLTDLDLKISLQSSIIVAAFPLKQFSAYASYYYWSMSFKVPHNGSTSWINFPIFRFLSYVAGRRLNWTRGREETERKGPVRTPTPTCQPQAELWSQRFGFLALAARWHWANATNGDMEAASPCPVLACWPLLFLLPTLCTHLLLPCRLQLWVASCF